MRRSSLCSRLARSTSDSSNLPQPDSTLQVIDVAFNDAAVSQRHRLGAYYQQRAVCIAFYVLNAFSAPVDFLFEKVMSLPLMATTTHVEALGMLSEKLKEGGTKGKFEARVEKLLKSEEMLHHGTRSTAT